MAARYLSSIFVPCHTLTFGVSQSLRFHIFCRCIAIENIMYRLAIFVLVSCVASQRLVGDVRNGGSPPGRSNLYFDSYNHPSLEEFEESEDGLRDAFMMYPEEVLDVPPISTEWDFQTADLDTEEHLREDRPYESVQNPQMTRGFIHDLLEEIQSAFSTWPPGLSSGSSPPPEYHYHLDSSLLEAQKTDLKHLLATVEEKTCLNVVENEDSPMIIFMGVQGCSIEAVGNKIVIGYECFEPTMILKLIFRLFGFCPTNLPSPTFKANNLYIDSYRSMMRRGIEEGTDCKDLFGFCLFLGRGNSSLSCSSASNFEKSICPRTCRICGDSCVDYDPDCNTRDTLKDCLVNWDKKKFGCAYTCGVCRNRKESSVCVDYFGCCQYYAKRGYCQKLPDVMKRFCPLSCGYCKPKSCIDLRADCNELKMLGGCHIIPDLMAKNCPRTCNICRRGVENRDSDDRRPPEDCSRDDDFVRKYCSWNTFIVD